MMGTSDTSENEKAWSSGGESGMLTQQDGATLDVEDPKLTDIENTPVFDETSEVAPKLDSDETTVDVNGEIARAILEDEALDLDVEGATGLATPEAPKPRRSFFGRKAGRKAVDATQNTIPVKDEPAAPAEAAQENSTPEEPQLTVQPTPETQSTPRPVPRPPEHELRYVSLDVPDRKKDSNERSPRRSRAHHRPQLAHELHEIHDQIKIKENLLEQEIDRAFEERRQAEEARLREREEVVAAEIAAEHAAAQHEAVEPEKTPEPPAKPTYTPNEKAWGLNNKRAKKDVDAYMAERPEAQEGEVVRSLDKNGKTIAYVAGTGQRISKDDYLNTLSPDVASTADYYAEAQQREAVSRDHEEALAHNEVIDRNTSEFLRANAEGEQLVRKNPDLTAVLHFAQEIQSLVDKKVTPEVFKTDIEPLLEEKKRVFALSYAQVEARGADQRALDYITYGTSIEVSNDEDGKTTVEIDDRTEPKGSAYFEGQRVKVVDFIESPDGKQKSYTIELEDGSTKTVHAQEVEFKREYVKPEAEAENLSRAQRLKQWMKAEFGMFVRLGGKAYFAGAMSQASGHVGGWLRNHRINKDATPEQAEGQRRISRRDLMLGAAATVVTAAAAVAAVRLGQDLFQMAPDGTDILSNLGPGGPLDAGIAPDSIPNIPPAPPTGETLSQQLKDILEGVGEAHYTAPAPEISAEALNNAAYNIPSGGGGYSLFEGLKLDRSLWDDNARELVKRFPQEFYLENGQVGIMKPGWLSEDARKFIEGLRAKDS